MNDECMQEWELISKQLEAISSYHLPRYIGICRDPDSIKYHIVCFCDASVMAYATTIYLHQSIGDTCKADLVFSKTRLAPQGTTIPRLELLGVLVGVRALKFVRQQLHQELPCHLFTDSVCVLYWLETSKPLSVFVSNRVKEIKTLETVKFSHVSSEDNPADLATIRNNANSRKESESEVKGNKVLYETKLISAEDPSKEPVDLSDIDERRYSSLYKLLRVTAWVSRFTNNLRKRNPKFEPHSTDEIQKAKLLWELHIQRKHYSDMIKNLVNGKKDNLQKQLKGLAEKGDTCHLRF